MCGSPSSGHKVIGNRKNGRQGFRPQLHSGFCVSIRQCSNCELIYPDPMPMPASLDQHYGVDVSNYWKPEYLEVDPNDLWPQLNDLKQLRSYTSTPRALDIGAGIGKHLVTLKRAGYDTWGIEPSSSFHRYAIDKMGMDPEKYLHASVEQAELPAASFDFIYMGAVFEHLYDPDAVLQRVLNWLAPNGLIFIEVPNARWLMATLTDFAYKIRGMDYTVHLSPLHSPFHIYEFSEKTFRLHAKRRGYKIELIRLYQGPTYAPKFLDPILHRWMQSTGTGMQLGVWISR